MVRVASEMERQGFEILLLLGGATTSRAHTAVKVDQQYHGPVVWVKDASRSVPVVSQLLSDGQRDAFLEGVAKDYDTIRTCHAAKTGERPLASYEAAVANRPQLDWAAHCPMRPHLLTQQTRDRWSGPTDSHWHRAATQFTRVWEDFLVGELRRYIDWTPFFLAWEIKGRYPDVLNNPATSEQARSLLDDANRMLDRIEREHWLSARGVVGIFPANGVGDDVEVYADEARSSVLTTLHGLRQQGQHRDGVANKCLSDYVAPKETGVADHVGAFSVTAGLGLEEHLRKFKDDLDDYSAIMLEALADRLAEAFAERLHEKVRRELWGYAPTSTCRCRTSSRRSTPASGPRRATPRPDHTEKETLMALLGGEERTGIRLTESMAMWPGASVSGWYFAHPESQYFVVGRLGRDQVESRLPRARAGPAHRRAVARPEPRLPAGGLTWRGGGDGVSAPRHTVSPMTPPCPRAAPRTSGSARRCSGSGRSTGSRACRPRRPRAARSCTRCWSTRSTCPRRADAGGRGRAARAAVDRAGRGAARAAGDDRRRRGPHRGELVRRGAHARRAVVRPRGPHLAQPGGARALRRDRGRGPDPAGYVDRLDVAPDGVAGRRLQDGPVAGRGVRGQGAVPDEVLRLRPVAHPRRDPPPAPARLPRQRRGRPLRPDERDLLAVERNVRAIWDAVVRAAQTGDWRPRTSLLCDWCDFRDLCPAWGGTPPPLPEGASSIALDPARSGAVAPAED